MKKAGATKPSFDTIVASGTNSSMPHHIPQCKKFVKSDVITIDLGCVYEGYSSDMTRTVFFGDISEENKNVYNIVLEAQNLALKNIKPKVNCNYIDKLARDYITDKSFGENFVHSLGHGVGLDIHEEPRLSPKCKTSLSENMVVTVEPGIYLPGKFGVRIEDLVVVTSSGCDILSKTTKEILIID